MLKTYLVACERGGVEADMQNMVLLFGTIRKTVCPPVH
jgi:hypothetical protein